MAVVGMIYLAAAMVVVPALLGVFRLLSHPPEVTSQPPRPVAEPARMVEPDAVGAESWSHVADEAERWLRSQSSS